jgi:TolA-binding protein
VPLLLVAATGCAYFNTFYLGRKNFRLAEASVAKNRTDKVPSDAVRAYEIAIAQSRKVLLNHPKSRWADDAIYVMSSSYYGKGDYDSAMIHVGDLEKLYPKSDLIPEGIHLSGLIEWKRRNYDEATTHLNRVLADYPKYKKRDDVIFALGNVAADRHDRPGAIAEYMRLARTYPKSRRVQDALQRSGEIYLDEGKYDSASVAFGRLLPKIRDDSKRIEIAVLQAQALTRLGRGEESLTLVRGLIPKEATVPLAPVAMQTTNPPGTNVDVSGQPTDPDAPNYNFADRTAEERASGAANQQSQASRAVPPPPANADDLARLRLQEASALNQLGQTAQAIAVLEDVTTRYQSSNYAVEAQFQIGYTYETLLDSLEAARAAYERVGSLPGRSVFKEQALQRADALKSQIQLEKQAQAGDAATEARAAAALRIAEILLLDRDRVDEALVQYRKVEEEFPDSRVAARAGYARAYIQWKRQADSLGAQREFRDLVARYPATTVARSAIRLLAAQGADTSGLHLLLRAVVPDTIPAPPDSLVAPADSSAAIPVGAPADSMMGPPGASGDPADSLRLRPPLPPRRGGAPPGREEEDIDLRRPARGDSGASAGPPAPAPSAPPDSSNVPVEPVPPAPPPSAPPDSSNVPVEPAPPAPPDLRPEGTSP